MIKINVKNKIATAVDNQDVIVCGNTDYQIKFLFSEEWDNRPIKTARFVWGGQYEEVSFNGDICNVPQVNDTTVVSVGVYSGELHTTTPALLNAKKSILCGSNAPHPKPVEDVYNQLVESINEVAESKLEDAPKDDIQYARKNGEWTKVEGSGGSNDYEKLDNQPKINNMTLIGNKSASDLGLAESADITAETQARQSADNGLQAAVNSKVTQVQGKDLSTNDYSNADKAAVTGINATVEAAIDDHDESSEAHSAIKDDISDINAKIPTQATSQNQLADRAFLNSSLNSITAFFITKDAQGNSFATKAELDAATQFYSGGQLRTPTRNDYCIVRKDEEHDDGTTRYIYQNGQWEFQYLVNRTPLTSDQLLAINSGITAQLVALIPTALQPAALNNYYTKTEADTAINAKINNTIVISGTDKDTGDTVSWNITTKDTISEDD